MPQNEVNQFDEVDNNNTDISGTTVVQGQMYPYMVDNAFRNLMGALARTIGDATIAAAATTNLGSLPGASIVVTGNTTITSFGTIKAGTIKFVKFTGTPTLAYNATSLILPGAANIGVTAGDVGAFKSTGSGNWECLYYMRGNGAALTQTNPAVTAMDSRPSLIVNGNFQMSQENGTTLGTANNFYFSDQFFLSFTASTAAMSAQLLTSVRTLSGNDRVGEFKTTTAKASLGATDFVTLSTVIEGSRPEWKAAAFGTAGAKPFVYRFEFTGPAGLYHMHFQNSAGNRHCAVPFTVAAPEANVATVRTLVLPADTTGTWLFGDGDKGLVCDLVLAAGATLTGGTASTWGATARLAATTQFNILSSTSNVARIADVGLKNDPDATGVYGLFKVNETDPLFNSRRYGRAYADLYLGFTLSVSELYNGGYDISGMAKIPTTNGAFATNTGSNGIVEIVAFGNSIRFRNSGSNWTLNAFCRFVGFLNSRI